MSETATEVPVEKTRRANQWLIDRLLPGVVLAIGSLSIVIIIWGFGISADVEASSDKVASLKMYAQAHNMSPASHINERNAVAQNTTDIKVLAEGTQLQIKAINLSLERVEADLKAQGVEMRGNMLLILQRLPPI